MRDKESSGRRFSLERLNRSQASLYLVPPGSCSPATQTCRAMEKFHAWTLLEPGATWGCHWSECHRLLLCSQHEALLRPTGETSAGFRPENRGLSPTFLKAELRDRAKRAQIGISALPPACCASLNRLLSLSELVSRSVKRSRER